MGPHTVVLEDADGQELALEAIPAPGTDLSEESPPRRVVTKDPSRENRICRVLSGQASGP